MRVFFKGLDYLEEGLIVIGMAFMTGMNFVNVVSRYCFANSFSYTEEATIITFIWVTMLGIAVGFKRVSHLGMSYFVELFPRKAQAFMALVSMLCSLTMIFFMVYEGYTMVENQLMLGAKTAAMGLPLPVQGLAIPVGGMFIGIRIIQSGINEFKRISAEARLNPNGGEPSCQLN